MTETLNLLRVPHKSQALPALLKRSRVASHCINILNDPCTLSPQMDDVLVIDLLVRPKCTKLTVVTSVASQS